MRYFTLQNHPKLPEFHGQEYPYCQGLKTEKEIINIFYRFHKKSNVMWWCDSLPFKLPAFFDLNYITDHWAVKFVTRKEDF